MKTRVTKVHWVPRLGLALEINLHPCFMHSYKSQLSLFHFLCRVVYQDGFYGAEIYVSPVPSAAFGEPSFFVILTSHQSCDNAAGDSHNYSMPTSFHKPTPTLLACQVTHMPLGSIWHSPLAHLFRELSQWGLDHVEWWIFYRILCPVPESWDVQVVGLQPYISYRLHLVICHPCGICSTLPRGITNNAKNFRHLWECLKYACFHAWSSRTSMKLRMRYNGKW